MPVSSVSYLQEGEGKDLVFLHGYLSSKESFYHQIEYFKQFYRVTAFDFWGMGKSPGPDTPWTVDDYASHTRAFLREAGFARVEKVWKQENTTLLMARKNLGKTEILP